MRDLIISELTRENVYKQLTDARFDELLFPTDPEPLFGHFFKAEFFLSVRVGHGMVTKVSGSGGRSIQFLIICSSTLILLDILEVLLF